MYQIFPYNDPHYKDIRRSLRKNPTQAEKMLWEKLKGKQLKGLKFRRQYGVGRYIIDLYCPELRLAIEIDGGYHFLNQVREYDREREEYIASFDIHFLRFTNEQIYSKLDEVLEEIEKTAKTIKTPS